TTGIPAGGSLWVWAYASGTNALVPTVFIDCSSPPPAPIPDPEDCAPPCAEMEREEVRTPWPAPMPSNYFRLASARRQQQGALAWKVWPRLPRKRVPGQRRPG